MKKKKKRTKERSSFEIVIEIEIDFEIELEIELEHGASTLEVIVLDDSLREKRSLQAYNYIYIFVIEAGDRSRGRR